MITSTPRFVSTIDDLALLCDDNFVTITNTVNKNTTSINAITKVLQKINRRSATKLGLIGLAVAGTLYVISNELDKELMRKRLNELEKVNRQKNYSPTEEEGDATDPLI